MVSEKKIFKHFLRKLTLLPPRQSIKFTDLDKSRMKRSRRDVPVGVPFNFSTPMGMSCIGTYGEHCKSDNVSKYRVLLVAFLILWHEN